MGGKRGSDKALWVRVTWSFAIGILMLGIFAVSRLWTKRVVNNSLVSDRNLINIIILNYMVYRYIITRKI